MQVTCSRCKTRLKIPDKKVPKQKKLALACPKCKQRIFVMPPQRREALMASPGNGIITTLPGYEYRDVDEVLELTIAEGEKVALLMIGDRAETQLVKKGAQEVGYRVVTAEDTRDALNKLRFHHFPMVFLSDGYDSMDIIQSPILRYLAHLPMNVRRKIFLVLVGSRFKSMDHMKAFAMSANLVVNNKDLHKLTPILSRALSDHEKFYNVFMETLKEVGKA